MTEMTITPTVHKYSVWTSDHEAVYIKADQIVFGSATVAFMIGTRITYCMFLDDFLKYNDRDIKPVGE